MIVRMPNVIWERMLVEVKRYQDADEGAWDERGRACEALMLYFSAAVESGEVQSEREE